MFYQYPWWQFYDEFSSYVARLSHLLSGGRHVAKTAVLWPASSIFAHYTPQKRNPLSDRTEFDFNVLTDLLLRLHHDFDYLDEDVLANAEIEDGAIVVAEERHELLIVPPMTHLKLKTVARLEEFVAAGGRILGSIFLPDRAFDTEAIVDVSDRIDALFGVEPTTSQGEYRQFSGIDVVSKEHRDGGRTSFIRSYALNRQLPWVLQEALNQAGRPESGQVVIEEEDGQNHYWFMPAEGHRQEITATLQAERTEVSRVLQSAIAGLIEPDVIIDNPEIFCLHRVKDGRDLWFLVNSTSQEQAAEMAVPGDVQPLLWDTSLGEERPMAPSRFEAGWTRFRVTLPPVGSAFVTTEVGVQNCITATNVLVDRVADGAIAGRIRGGEAYVTLSSDEDKREERISLDAGVATEPLTLDGEWEFVAEDDNALVIQRWLAIDEDPNQPRER